MTSDLDRQMREDAPDQTDKLAAIRAELVRRRSLDLEIKDAEAKFDALKAERRRLELEQLPTMFAEAGITSLGIPADGNMPAQEAKLRDYVHASIPTSWPEEKRRRAFDVLRALGSGDIVRRTVSVYFPAGSDDATWQTIVNLLRDRGLQPAVQMEVPWQTLTATVRALMDSENRPTAEQRDAIGAFVGKIVKLTNQER